VSVVALSRPRSLSGTGVVVPARFRAAIIVALCAFASLTNLKVGVVEFGEIFLMMTLAGWTVCVAGSAGVIVVHDTVAAYARRYGWLFLMVIALALWHAATETFYPPSPTEPWLRTPPWISFARTSELAIVVFGFLMMLQMLIASPHLRRLAVHAYIWAGTVSAAYALLSELGFRLGIEPWANFYGGGMNLGGVYGPPLTILRARGFFIEGGSFGLYLSTALLLLFLHRAFGLRLSRRQFFAHLAIQALAFTLSYSKAGLANGMALLLIYMVCPGRGRGERNLVVSLLLIAVVVATAVALKAVDQAFAYLEDYSKFEAQIAAGRADDKTLIMGRATATIIVPRMVAAAPILGVGLGNYSVTRNDPRYRGFLPAVDEWDEPGLGLLSYVPELGIPLSCYLVGLLCLPGAQILRRGLGPALATTAACQPMTHFFGAQVTFFYPWIVAAIAISTALASDAARPQNNSGTIAARPT
jgi:hypothetical protein